MKDDNKPEEGEGVDGQHHGGVDQVGQEHEQHEDLVIIVIVTNIIIINNIIDCLPSRPVDPNVLCVC